MNVSIGVKTLLIIGFFYLILNELNAQKLDTAIMLNDVEIYGVKPSNNYTITSIDSSILQANPNASLDEILNKASDVFIKNYGTGALSTVSFRGMGSSHTKIYWNGISLNSSMNGTFDLSLFNMNATDKVDIHYGASSLIDGSGSLGGSVKLENVPSFGKGTQINLSQSIGSFSTYKTLGRIELSNKKLFADIRFAYIKSKNDFQYLNPSKPFTPKEEMKDAEFMNLNITGNVGWLMDKENIVQLYFIHQESDRNLPKLNQQENVNEFQNDYQNIGFLRWSYFGKKLQGEFKAGLKSSVLEYENGNIQLESKSKEDNFFVQERWRYILFKKVKSSSSFLYDYVEAFNDKYGSTKFRNEFQMIHDFQWEMNKKWKSGVLIKSHFIDKASLPFLPSANLGYKAIENLLKISANFSYHGAIPSINDLFWGEGGNPNLKPEKGLSSELNFQGNKQLKKSGINYRISGYYSDISDWILWSPNPSGIWKVSNVSKVKSYGLEANLGIVKNVVGNFLSAKLAYNWNVSKDRNHNQLLYVPVHRAQFNLGWKWKKLNVTYNHQYINQRFINSENTAWLPSYFLADVAVSYFLIIKKKNKIQTSFKVNNLFNEPFQSVANRPMAGRNYTFTLSYSLK